MSAMDTAWLNDRRKELGVTQKDLARTVNRQQSAGNRICRGKRPVYLDEIEAVADLLQVSKPEMLRRAGIEVEIITKLDRQTIDEGLLFDVIEHALGALAQREHVVLKGRLRPDLAAEDIVQAYGDMAEGEEKDRRNRREHLIETFDHVIRFADRHERIQDRKQGGPIEGQETKANRDPRTG